MRWSERLHVQQLDLVGKRRLNLFQQPSPHPLVAVVRENTDDVNFYRIRLIPLEPNEANQLVAIKCSKSIQSLQVVTIGNDRSFDTKPLRQGTKNGDTGRYICSG